MKASIHQRRESPEGFRTCVYKALTNYINEFIIVREMELNNYNTDAKIDVHKAKKSYLVALDRFQKDDEISQINKNHILKYLRECSLGKTVSDKQKKKIHEKRLLKYIYTLPKISYWLDHKDFKQIATAEMEDFICRLEQNALKVRKNGILQPVTYADWSRRDIKVCLRKFYKWLLGEGKYFPELVSWIDTHIDKTPPPSLSLEEIRKCVEYTQSTRGKALVWTLF